MEFIKKNYEKIILGLVLLGLVGVLIGMWFVIQADVQSMTDLKNTYLSPSAKPLPDLDLSRAETALARLKTPPALDFSTTNKLFNPVQWQKTPDGRLIKVAASDVVGLAVVTKITPLCLILTLDSIETNEFGARYVISMERQAAGLPAQRVKRQHYASVGEKNETFTIADVNGSPGDPAQLKLILQLTDTGERATLSKDKPFRRVDGYAADLKYDLEKPPRTWQGQRIGADLKFAGDDNIIVAINQDTVILLARSNQKKTTLTYSPSP